MPVERPFVVLFDQERAGESDRGGVWGAKTQVGLAK